MQLTVELPASTIGFHAVSMMGDGLWTISASIDNATVITVENASDLATGLRELEQKIANH